MLSLTALGASATTVVSFYPYRDFVKGFHPQKPFLNMNPTFWVDRYKGMILNPAQPLILSLPTTSMIVGFYGLPQPLGLLVGSTGMGTIQSMIRAYVNKLSDAQGIRYYGGGGNGFAAVVRAGTHTGGPFGWFVGAGASSVLSFMVPGMALMRRPYRRQDFLSDWLTIVGSHASLTTISSPLRTPLRAAKSVSRRNTAIKSAGEYIQGEAAIFAEAYHIAARMLRDVGIRYFLSDILTTTFKVSIPFGFNVALFHTFYVQSVTSRYRH